MEKICVGIDLGTTYSLVAAMEDGVPKILANELGEELMPSAVAMAEDHQLLVGRAAIDRMIVKPEDGCAFFKRDMGSQTTYQLGKEKWTAIDCSARVLSELKRVAEMRLGQEVTSAVISVPAYFHNEQREATLQAAKIAGLQVERLINEPTAAALAYGFRAGEELTNVLVFDLGGGTFDVTLLELFDGVIEVKATGGESRLGGEDYTDALMQWLIHHHRVKVKDEEAGVYREKIQKIKKKLSFEDEAILEWNGQSIKVSLADFKTATQGLTARLRPVVLRVLRDAKMEAKMIDAILLVGGASRMKLIREMMEYDFKGIEIREVDPDRIVALGACVQMGLCMDHAAVADIVLTDVCPHTLGLEISHRHMKSYQQDGLFSPIIDRNTMLPCSKSGLYHALHEDQDVINLKIYQGEARLVKENHFIGEVVVTGVKAYGKSDVSGTVDVRFSYDMNGVLEVEATILHSGKIVSKVFQQSLGMLTEVQVQESIRRFQSYKIHPRDMVANRAILERANRLFMDLRGEMREELDLMIRQFEVALDSQDLDRYQQKREELEGWMKRILPED
jgi:molecular chaperone HscC